MNKEAYVSFKCAKLLKEKGFDWECRAFMFEDDSEIKLGVNSHTYKDFESKNFKHLILLPTQQMACDWVEKTYGFFIEISRSIDLNGGYHYFYMILDKECKYASSSIHDNNYPGKSDAIEAALEYILTKLI